MSPKPPKHSEQKRVEKTRQTAARRFKNSWNVRRERSSPVPIRPVRHLIVTEGTKTEPNYFEAIRCRINDKYHGERVVLEVRGTGRNTLSLFEKAKQIADADPDGYAHVWVVYDKDDFAPSDFNETAVRCKNESTHEREFHAAWTNEAFELWYLLHFEYLQSALSRDMYLTKLSSHLGSQGLGAYRKNDEGMFAKLETRMGIAIERARKLQSLNSGRTPSESNPGTMVHVLVDQLLPFLKS